MTGFVYSTSRGVSSVCPLLCLSIHAKYRRTLYQVRTWWDMVPGAATVQHYSYSYQVRKYFEVIRTLLRLRRGKLAFASDDHSNGHCRILVTRGMMFMRAKNGVRVNDTTASARSRGAPVFCNPQVCLPKHIYMCETLTAERAELSR